MSVFAEFSLLLFGQLPDEDGFHHTQCCEHGLSSVEVITSVSCKWKSFQLIKQTDIIKKAMSVDGKMSILGQSVTKYPAALEYFLSQPRIAEFD